MSPEERKKARALANAWRDTNALQDVGAEWVADSLARRLLMALDELDRRDKAATGATT